MSSPPRIWTPFSFLAQAVRFQGSPFRLVIGRVMMFALWAAILSFIHYTEWIPVELHIDVAPYEAAGAVLGLLLVFRTNAGYERWWEARKLWGAIVNDTRSLAIAATSYGPGDPAWRRRVAGWIASYAHACRRSLRDEVVVDEMVPLLGEADAAALARADHMPSFTVVALAKELRAGLDDFAFLQSDAVRVRLLDDIGGCERIKKTPMPLAYAIEVRRFIFLFLLTLPSVLFDKIDGTRGLWLVPLLMLMIAYPFLAVDKIGHELQHPFATYRLNHLPLDDITTMIERNVFAILAPGAVPREDAHNVTPPIHPEPHKVASV